MDRTNSCTFSPSRYTHVYVEPVEQQVVVTAQETQISPGYANAVHKILETRIGAQRIEGWPHED